MTRAARSLDPATLARNALAGGGRHVVSAVAALLVVPYTVTVLGVPRFGVWALAGAVLTTLHLLDLGIERALTREVALGQWPVDGRTETVGQEANGSAHRRSARSAVSTGRAMLLSIGALGIVVVWLFRDPLTARLFAVPEPLRAEARLVMAGTAVVAAVDLAAVPWRSALDGVGRMDLSHGVETLQRVVSAIGVVIVLSLGWGLVGLVVKNLFTSIVAAAALRALVARRAQHLRGTGVGFSPPTARGLLAHGGWIQAGNLAHLIIEPAHKALLSRGPGLAAVAAYEIAVRVAGQFGGLFSGLGLAIYPAAAADGVRRSSGERAGLHDWSTRWVARLALPTGVLLVVLAVPFVDVWLGPAADAATRLAAGGGMAALAAGWAVAILAMPTFLIAQAEGGGRLRDATTGVLIHVVVSAGGAAVLVGPLGYHGVIVAAAVGLAVSGLALWWLIGRRTDVGWTVARPALDGPAWASAATAGVSAWLVLAGAAWWHSASGGVPEGGRSIGDVLMAPIIDLPPETGWVVLSSAGAVGVAAAGGTLAISGVLRSLPGIADLSGAMRHGAGEHDGGPP